MKLEYTVVLEPDEEEGGYTLLFWLSQDALARATL